VNAVGQDIYFTVEQSNKFGIPDYGLLDFEDPLVIAGIKTDTGFDDATMDKFKTEYLKFTADKLRSLSTFSNIRRDFYVAHPDVYLAKAYKPPVSYTEENFKKENPGYTDVKAYIKDQYKGWEISDTSYYSSDGSTIQIGGW
jgi:hypothetical protein